MGTLLWVVFGLVGVSALIYYAAGVIFGPGEEIIAADPDRAPVAVADNRVLVAQDIENVRFPMAVRGYRMDEVDKFLDRIADELTIREAISARSRFLGVDDGLDPGRNSDLDPGRDPGHDPGHDPRGDSANVSNEDPLDDPNHDPVPSWSAHGEEHPDASFGAADKTNVSLAAWGESTQTASDDVAGWAANPDDIPEAGEDRLE